MTDQSTAPVSTSLSVLKEGNVSVEDSVFLLLLFFSVAAFWSDLRALVRLCLSRDEYSHIILIPFVSAFLIYRNRQKIFISQAFDVGVGLPLVIIGIGLHILALISGTQSPLFAVTAVLLFVLGSFAACYGRKAFLAAMFPLLFLVFMLPLPNATMDQVILFLQRGSAALSEVLLSDNGNPGASPGIYICPAGCDDRGC
jgi:exosortase